MFHGQQKNKPITPLFEAGDFKIHHTIRNRIFFEMNVTTKNKPIYFVNLFSFMGILLIKALLSNNMKSFCMIARSVVNGFEFYKKTLQVFKVNTIWPSIGSDSFKKRWWPIQLHLGSLITF
jgi:hypothetical protein